MSNESVFKKRREWSGGKFKLNHDEQGLWVDCNESTIGLETGGGDHGFWFSRGEAAELARVLTEFSETGEINTDGYEEFKESPVVPIDRDSMDPLERAQLEIFEGLAASQLEGMLKASMDLTPRWGLSSLIEKKDQEELP